jgi:hypothetical protein
MLGYERPEDLRMLCRRCHDRAHGKRRHTRLWGFVARVAVALVFLAMLWQQSGLARS